MSFSFNLGRVKLSFKLLGLGSCLWLWGWLWGHPVQAEIQLPPDDEIPEEILRTEIIFEARSPLDGQAMTPADYAALQAELQTYPDSPLIDEDLQGLIFLLEIRRTIKPIVPFIR